MLVQAAAASCWVVGSSTAAAVPPSLSARRDSERASRRSAVIAFADGGSGLSMSLSAMPLILRCPTTDSRPIEPRHQCRKRIGKRLTNMPALATHPRRAFWSPDDAQVV
jgi:hypothetical protein